MDNKAISSAAAAPRERFVGSVGTSGLAQAREIVAAAEADAARIRALAMEEAVRLREAAYQAGRARGEEEAAALVLQTSRRVQRALGECSAEVIDLAFDTCAQVLADDPGPYRQALSRRISRALPQLAGQQRVELCLHPDDLPSFKEKLRCAERPDAELVLTADPTVARGDAILRSRWCTVECCAASHLAALRRWLHGGVADGQEGLP